MPNSSSGFQPNNSPALGLSASMQWQEKARKATEQAGGPRIPARHVPPPPQAPARPGGTFHCVKNFIPDMFVPAWLRHFPDHVHTLMLYAVIAAMRSWSVCPCQQPCGGSTARNPGVPQVLSPAPAGPAWSCHPLPLHTQPPMSCTVNPASKKCVCLFILMRRGKNRPKCLQTKHTEPGDTTSPALALGPMPLPPLLSGP